MQHGLADCDDHASVGANRDRTGRRRRFSGADRGPNLQEAIGLVPDAALEPADGPCHHADGGVLGVQARGVRIDNPGPPRRLGRGRRHLLQPPSLEGRVLQRHSKLPMQSRKVLDVSLSAPLGPLPLSHIAGALPESVQHRFHGLAAQASAIVRLPVAGLTADNHVSDHG